MNPDKLFLYQQFAATLLDYAVNGEKGRDELDPIYQQIVEERDGPTAKQRARYSSCADLAFWLYARLGCIGMPTMNRDEEPGIGGESDWIVSVNLNRWCGPPIGPNKYAKKAGEYEFDTGDVIVVNNRFGGHVIVVTACESDMVFTAEYGQPGGKAKEHNIDNYGVGMKNLNGNPILAHTRMIDVLEGEEKSGRLGPADVDVLNGWQSEDALREFRRQLNSENYED